MSELHFSQLDKELKCKRGLHLQTAAGDLTKGNVKLCKINYLLAQGVKRPMSLLNNWLKPLISQTWTLQPLGVSQQNQSRGRFCLMPTMMNNFHMSFLQNKKKKKVSLHLSAGLILLYKRNQFFF